MKSGEQNSWPAGVAMPAQRALASAGYTSVEQLAGITEAELAQLHGMGPKALTARSQALAGQGLSFKST